MKNALCLYLFALLSAINAESKVTPPPKPILVNSYPIGRTSDGVVIRHLFSDGTFKDYVIKFR